MSYKCANVKCGELIPNLTDGVVRCPSCGHRILYKMREPITKIIKAE